MVLSESGIMSTNPWTLVSTISAVGGGTNRLINANQS